MKKKKIVAVLPAYKASKTLLPFLDSFPKKLFYKIILVDDSSPDKTFELAKKQKGINAFTTDKNLGYGGNIKLCFKKALDAGADVIVELHPDGEYLPDGIEKALKEIEKGAWLVLGNRFTPETSPLKTGMFIWKYPLIRLVNLIHNILLLNTIPDLHQGFRVYRSALLKEVGFENNKNGYIFFFEIVVKTIQIGKKIESVPVSTHYRGKKRGASFKNSVIYTLDSFRVILNFWIEKLGLSR